MPNDLVIAFCGSEGAGKDTTADLFQSLLLEYDTENRTFAFFIKQACADLWNLDPKVLWGANEEKQKPLETPILLTRLMMEDLFDYCGIDRAEHHHKIRKHLGKDLYTVRDSMNYLGTEILRDIDLNFHNHKLRDSINPNVISLVRDLRFPNEFDFLQTEYEGKIIPVYVSNPLIEKTALQSKHSSALGFLEFRGKCTKVLNDSTMDVLKTRTRVVFNDIIVPLLIPE